MNLTDDFSSSGVKLSGMIKDLLKNKNKKDNMGGKLQSLLPRASGENILNIKDYIEILFVFVTSTLLFISGFLLFLALYLIGNKVFYLDS